MAPRVSARPSRSRNPRVVAASAILRSLESATPSRLSTLRLLADALLLCARSSEVTRTGAHTSTSVQVPGSRALLNAAVAVLLTLPAIGGTLQRRAIALLRAVAPTAGGAALLSAAERARAQLGALRAGGIVEGDVRNEAAFAAAARAVAETSRYDRVVADESLRILLTVKGSRVVRAYAAHAAAYVLESYPTNFAPHVRMLDTAVDAVQVACASTAIAKGVTPKPGFAMLASVLAPLLAARQNAVERLLRACAHALAEVPGEEKGPWAAAVVRVALVLRTTRGRRQVRTDFEKRKRTPPQTSQKVPVGELVMFETTLVTVARVTGLASARAGCTLALTAALSAWASALTDNRGAIPSRVVALLAKESASVAAASTLRDAICTSVIPTLNSSVAYGALDALCKSTGVHGKVADALLVDLCSVLVRRFGAQAVLDPLIGSGDTRMELDNSLLDRLIELTRTALATNFAASRLSGVRLVTALSTAVPQERVQLLTSVLQGLRVGDLQLDGSDGIGLEDLVSPQRRSSPSANAVATGLGAVLGNAVALAALVEECASGNEEGSVPKLVLKQAAIAATNLMRPLDPASPSDHYRERVATAIRRRAGWAIFAALGRAGAVEESVNGGMARLFDHWRDDLCHKRRKQTAEKDPFAKKEPAKVEVDDILLEPEEMLAETAMRTAALSALASCLEFESSLELRKFAPFLIGSSAARVAQARNAPQDGAAPPPIAAKSSSVMDDPLFYRASLNSKTELNDPIHTDAQNAQLSHALLQLAESMQIARCCIFAPPVGVAGELCYYIALALGEDAQKALGDAAGVNASGGVVAQFFNSFNKQTIENGAIANRRLSLCMLRNHAPKRERSKTATSGTNVLSTTSYFREDLAWMCSTEGVEMPIAEEAIVLSAHAISALVVESISLPESVCEEFCTSAAFSPIFSAAVALAVARRISSSDLAENGRVLAMLQILVTRAIKASVVDYTAAKIDTRATSEGPWNGTCTNDADLPGSVFRCMAANGATTETRRPLLFPVETPLRSVAYNCAHTRTVGMVFAAGEVAAAAFRELAVKGGSAMWIGLVKSTTMSLRQSLQAKNPTQVNLAATSALVLGNLLRAIPKSRNQNGEEVSIDPHKIVVRDAVHAISDALESNQAHVQSAAALSLIESLEDIAKSSERTLAALTRAWSLDDGVDKSPGQVFKSADNIICWETCVDRICNRVVKKNGSADTKTEPFLCPTVPTCSIISPAFAIGSSAVLTSSGLYGEGFVESTAVAAAELCTELLHWSGVASFTAQAAGFRGLSQMWMARILCGKVEHSMGGPPRSPEGFILSSYSAKRTPGHYLPIHFFSIRQPAQAGSSAGLYLEDVIYDAFLSGRKGIASGLQNTALNVVYLLLRESGRKAVSANFQRLPEILFKAAQDGLLECQNILEILADADAVKRPKYWIGLCRAVALGGKRLNAETPNAVWDLNVDTRRMALRIIRVAVTSSMAKCKCKTVVNADTSQGENVSNVVHTCAMGCIKESLDALLAAMQITPVDASAVSEACGSLKMMAARLQCKARLELIGDTARLAFQNQWSSIAVFFADILNSKSPHRVIQAVAETATQWLLVGCFLNSDHILADMKLLCCALFGKELAGITRRFEYLEKSELCGTQTVICVLGAIAQLASTRALHAQLFGPHQVDIEIAEHLPVLKNLLHASIVDYNALQSKHFCSEISRIGGAVSFPGPSERKIRRCFDSAWPWIVVGANVLTQVDAIHAVEMISWIDNGSPGVEILRIGVDEELQIVSLCFSLWLRMVQDTNILQNLFDPYDVFMDVARFSAEICVNCMPMGEQNSAIQLIAGYGSSLDEIKLVGVERFGMRDGRTEQYGFVAPLSGNLSEILLSSSEPSGAPKLEPIVINIDDSSKVDNETQRVCEPVLFDLSEDDENHVLDRENDDDLMLSETSMDEENDNTSTEEEEEPKYREALSTDGRLLRAAMKTTDLEDLNVRETPSDASLSAAVITFDDLEANIGEPALPASQHDTKDVAQGISVSEPRPAQELHVDGPTRDVSQKDSDNIAHMKTEDSCIPSLEPPSMDHTKTNEPKNEEQSANPSDLPEPAEPFSVTGNAESIQTDGEQIPSDQAGEHVSVSSQSQKKGNVGDEIAEFAESVAESVMLSMLKDDKIGENVGEVPLASDAN